MVISASSRIPHNVASTATAGGWINSCWFKVRVWSRPALRRARTVAARMAVLEDVAERNNAVRAVAIGPSHTRGAPCHVDIGLHKRNAREQLVM